MYHPLTKVTLRDGESVELGRVRGPDLQWAGRIETLLAHKEPLYKWQNSSLVREDLNLDADFYLLHRDGDPLANVMTVQHRHAGFLGHVWTRPEDRRKGAAAHLIETVMRDTRARGGQALFLSTEFGGAACHLYADHGFRSIEEGSGHMAWFAEDEHAFYQRYFGPEETELREIRWCDWPASAALFLGGFPVTVRSLGMQLLGRISTEGPFLDWFWREQQLGKQGHPPRGKVLACPGTGAVAGLAHWSWDPQWPATCLLDFFCHPAHGSATHRLLDGIALPPADRCIACCDADDRDKAAILAERDFRRTAVLPRRVAKDHGRGRFIDVEIWERNSR